MSAAAPMRLPPRAAIVSWGCQLVAAGILLQTLFYKFSGAKESVWIFSRLGIEPWGRIGTGALELVAAALLLIPAAIPIGALLTSGLMVGAILSHLGPLGIEVQGDGGLLFGLALTVLACGLLVAWLRRASLVLMIRRASARWSPPGSHPGA
jgi:uncharacterized membrane protein YphA (DoxX/SURF4 family)